ncbi:MAG TPA: cytochrome P450 [Bryobacteraceae bacterium]|nr:cytochrome P450 [Bryobacteraceae bacterium]
MFDLFSEEMRRNPFAAYDHFRATSPVLHVPPPFNGWMMFDYATVKQVLTDHQTFSSRIPASPFSFIFTDPPEHRRLRNVISRAFTPDMIAALEPSIRQISQELFDGAAETDSMDFARDISGPLAMKVIAGIIGIPQEDWSRYRTWNDAILGLTFTRSGTERAERAMRDFRQATQEMSAYLEDMIAERRKRSQDDLLTRLIAAEVDGESLTHAEILAFFQLLMFAGQETTTNLLNNAVLCFLECPEAWKRLGGEPELLAGAIEEVLRFRSPFQWAMRTPTRDVEIHGQVIPKGALVLPMIGSANRDPAAFVDPNRFDITRSPNPHIAFGHGIHFCLGAPLSRLEARVALSDLLNRVASFEYAGGDPWQPRPGLMVYGPANLPITLRMRELH